MFCCAQKKNIVLPRRNQKKDNDYAIDTGPTRELLGEVLSCGTCKKAFPLRDNQIVAYCDGCYQFMHCGIAGSCVGPNCTYRIGNEIYRQSWCINCVPKTVLINTENIGKDCLCQECLDDPRTPNPYKKKI